MRPATGCSRPGHDLRVRRGREPGDESDPQVRASQLEAAQGSRQPGAVLAERRQRLRAGYPGLLQRSRSTMNGTIASMNRRSDESGTPPNASSKATAADRAMPCAKRSANRSEEHTSELQSRENLVCRLLLE